jgi:hypothetical protein
MSLHLPAICFGCRHWNNDKIQCPAFPYPEFDGVPEEILSGENDHSKIIEGQKGDYIFEKIDGSSNI